MAKNIKEENKKTAAKAENAKAYIENGKLYSVNIVTSNIGIIQNS